MALAIGNDISLKGLSASSALDARVRLDARVSSPCLELPAFVTVGYNSGGSASNRVSWLALLGGEISSPHLHLAPLLHVLADVPKVTIPVPADDGEPKKLNPLYILHPKDFMIFRRIMFSVLWPYQVVMGSLLWTRKFFPCLFTSVPSLLSSNKAIKAYLMVSPILSMRC